MNSTVHLERLLAPVGEMLQSQADDCSAQRATREAAIFDSYADRIKAGLEVLRGAKAATGVQVIEGSGGD